MKLFLLYKKLYDLAYIYLKGTIPYARRKGVKVGEGCRIYITQWGSEPFLISIGDRVTITSGVRLITHDGSTWLIRDEKSERYQKYLPISIGSDVFIGLNTLIMPGVTIGNNVVIGAGSVVTKNIPDNSVAVGNPARVISTYDALDKKIRATCIHNSEIQHIVDYQERVNLAIKLFKEKNSEPK